MDNKILVQKSNTLSLSYYKVAEVKQKAKKCGHDEGVERSA